MAVGGALGAMGAHHDQPAAERNIIRTIFVTLFPLARSPRVSRSDYIRAEDAIKNRHVVAA